MNVEELAAVIKARRKDINEQAPCDYCGTSLIACKAERGKDPTAPPWLGCCAVGTELGPCRHQRDSHALDQLLKEIERGEVRPVEEIQAERDAIEAERRARRSTREADRVAGRPTSYRASFDQGVWWKTRDSGWIRIADMQASHRANTARFLERRAGSIVFNLSMSELAMMSDAPDDVVDSWIHEDDDKVKDPVGWLRGTVIYRALVDGLPRVDAQVPDDLMAAEGTR